MGEYVAEIVDTIVIFPSIIVFTVLIIRYKLKKKELEMRGKELEMRGSDPELGPVVDALRDDLNDTRAQLTDMQERLDFAERFAHRRTCIARGQKWVTVFSRGSRWHPAFFPNSIKSRPFPVASLQQ